MDLTKIYYMGPDWISFSTDIRPDIELNGQVQSARGVYKWFAYDEERGIMINMEPRQMNQQSNLKDYAIHLQGKWFRHRGCLELVNFLDDYPDYKIQRLDWRLDYEEKLGLFEKPKKGKVGSFMVDGKVSGWKTYSQYYQVRNYDKTVESNGMINSIYQIDKKSRVYRLELQVCSRIINQLKIGHDLVEVVNLAMNRLAPYTDINVSCKKLEYKPPEVENQIKYWEQKRDIAIMKIEILKKEQNNGVMDTD